jgi:hypothetical protein
MAQRREPRGLLGKDLTIDVVAHARWYIVVNVIKVVFGRFPKRISRKVRSDGMSIPTTPVRTALHGAL